VRLSFAVHLLLQFFFLLQFVFLLRLVFVLQFAAPSSMTLEPISELNEKESKAKAHPWGCSKNGPFSRFIFAYR
jgi:hypothetical protein